MERGDISAVSLQIRVAAYPAKCAIPAYCSDRKSRTTVIFLLVSDRSNLRPNSPQ